MPGVKVPEVVGPAAKSTLGTVGVGACVGVFVGFLVVGTAVGFFVGVTVGFFVGGPCKQTHNTGSDSSHSVLPVRPVGFAEL